MDRVTFMGRSINRKFPLIGCWSRKDLFDRRDFELKRAREFGTGVLKPRLVIENKTEAESHVQEEHHVHTIGEGKKVCIQVFDTYMVYNIFLIYVAFFQIMLYASVFGFGI